MARKNKSANATAAVAVVATPAKKMTAQDVVEHVVGSLMRRYGQAMTEFRKWNERLSNAEMGCDVAYAVEWSDAAFTCAAKAKVTQIVILGTSIMVAKGMTGEEMLAALHKTVSGEVLRGAMYPSHSTSGASNTMAGAQLAAYASVLETIQQTADFADVQIGGAA